MPVTITPPEPVKEKDDTRPYLDHRVLGGQHIQRDADGVERKYFPGEVFRNREKLYERYPEKFEGVMPGVPSNYVQPTMQRPDETSEQFAKRMEALVADANKAMLESIQKEIERNKVEQPSVPAVQAVATDATFDLMTVDELRKFAESEEINLHGAKTKDAMLKVIKGSMTTAGV